jgi:multiple sugar transport system substrate-binding protein
MIKKFPALLASLALAGSTLFGCGGGQQASSSNNGGGEAKTDGQVTLKFYHWYSEQEGNWKKTIGEFEKKYPNIKVESIPLSESNTADEAAKKIDLLYASGEQMDVVMFSGPNQYAQRAGVGMFEPLNKYLEKDGVKYNDEYKIDTSINGQYFALPGKYIEYFTILNKDQLDEAGLPVPKDDWTWDEFMDYSKKLTKGEGANKRYGTFFWNRPQYNRLALQSKPEKNDILLPDGTSNLDDPLLKKSLELKNQMENVDKSATPLSQNISQKMNYRDEYFNGRASMLVTGNWMIPEVGGSQKYPAKFKTVFAPFPKINKNDPNNAPISLDTVSVSSNSKHKEEAYKFVRWFTTEGQVVQAKFIPSWKKADINKVIDNLISGTATPDKADKESLKYVIEHSAGSKMLVPPTYMTEAEKAFGDEVQKYLLGEQDLDTTLKNGKEQVNKIIQANKK